MKKLTALLLTIIAIALFSSFATYRVVMNNLVIDEVDYGYTATIFGYTDEYVVREPRYFSKTTDGVELYSPTSDAVTTSDAISYDSDVTALMEWLIEEEIPGSYVGEWIYIREANCEKDAVIQAAMNCFCIVKVEDGMINIMPYFYWAISGDSWDITGVQPVY